MENEKIAQILNRLIEIDSNLSIENFDKNIESEINNTLLELTKEINYDEPEIEVGIKKLTDNAIIPSYAKSGDAGMDLYVTSIINEDDDKITYGFGVAIEIPKNYVGLLFPRSSISKFDLLLSNCVGVIDSGYRGEIMSVFRKTRNNHYYKIGDRAIQIIILPYPKIKFIEKTSLSETERGEGGFGHTGKS